MCWILGCSEYDGDHQLKWCCCIPFGIVCATKTTSDRCVGRLKNWCIMNSVLVKRNNVVLVGIVLSIVLISLITRREVAISLLVVFGIKRNTSKTRVFYVVTLRDVLNHNAAMMMREIANYPRGMFRCLKFHFVYHVSSTNGFVMPKSVIHPAGIITPNMFQLPP